MISGSFLLGLFLLGWISVVVKVVAIKVEISMTTTLTTTGYKKRLTQGKLRDNIERVQ